MEKLKNLVWFAVGGVILLNMAGVSPTDIQNAANDFRQLVIQELQDMDRNEDSEWNSDSDNSSWGDEGPTMIAAERPNTNW